MYHRVALRTETASLCMPLHVHTHTHTHTHTHIHSHTHTHTHNTTRQARQTLYHVYVVDVADNNSHGWSNWLPATKHMRDGDVDTTIATLVLNGQTFPCYNGYCWVDMNCLVQECVNMSVSFCVGVCVCVCVCVCLCVCVCVCTYECCSDIHVHVSDVTYLHLHTIYMYVPFVSMHIALLPLSLRLTLPSSPPPPSSPPSLPPGSDHRTERAPARSGRVGAELRRLHPQHADGAQPQAGPHHPTLLQLLLDQQQLHG